jgi:hypothetical protein
MEGAKIFSFSEDWEFVLGYRGYLFLWISAAPTDYSAESGGGDIQSESYNCGKIHSPPHIRFTSTSQQDSL